MDIVELILADYHEQRRTFYPHLPDTGQGARGADTAGEEAKDAIRTTTTSGREFGASASTRPGARSGGLAVTDTRIATAITWPKRSRKRWLTTIALRACRRVMTSRSSSPSSRPLTPLAVTALIMTRIPNVRHATR